MSQSQEIMRTMMASAAEIEKLRREKAELLAALEWALKQVSVPQSYFPGHPDFARYDEACAAIAKFTKPTTTAGTPGQ